MLVLNKANCRPLIDQINCLVDLITLAHLHQGRALPNTKTNVIEAGPNQRFAEEKDWYYNIEKEEGKPERCGPVTFSEVCFLNTHFLDNRMCPNTFTVIASFTYISVERVVGSKDNHTTNPLLGNRHGWLAIVTTITSIEMVFDGQRLAAVQRNRIGVTHSGHSDHVHQFLPESGT